ncbi:MAG: HAMP domain-containing protein [Hyphomicrobiales bacterium]|nr:HAMP domain-containing protein [Hyphomicrobiales bacterium]
MTWSIQASIGELASAASGPAAERLSAVHAQANTLFNTMLIGTIAGVLMVTVVSIPLMHRAVAAPLRHLADRMDGLASGDTQSDIPHTGRSDEIGRIATSLLTLRDAVKHNAELMGEISEQSASLAKLHRSSKLLETVEEFSGSLGEMATHLESVMGQLTESTAALNESSQFVSHSSKKAIEASGDASSDVSAVAIASEQLQNSIAEIDRQVIQSTQIVAAAVEQTHKSAQNMTDLSASAQRIGDVIESISRIAAQTNLLALNATIEAARAGEAGKGFSVVAQEVKALASQTALATADIAGQIADIQSATRSSVDAIESIQGKIVEVEHISSIIASSIHEQALSTREIARSVKSAADGASAMSESVQSVEQFVADNGASVVRVVALIRDLDAMAARLRERVRDLGKTLEAA